jgi:hypothetical protein
MKNNKIIIPVLVMFAIILLGVIGIAVYKARTPSIPNSLESFFGDTSCSWPCWQGITPGVTTNSEALRKLQDSPLVYSIQTQERNGVGGANWFWKNGATQPVKGNLAWWQDGIVSSIGLSASPVIPLEEILKKFGPPEKIGVSSDLIEGPPRQWFVTLFYATKGFAVQYNPDRDENEKNIQILPASPINFVNLFKPTSIEDWILSYGADPNDYNLQDWKGYGNLLELYGQ